MQKELDIWHELNLKGIRTKMILRLRTFSSIALKFVLTVNFSKALLKMQLFSYICTGHVELTIVCL